jgi:hypothetical protein
LWQAWETMARSALPGYFVTRYAACWTVLAYYLQPGCEGNTIPTVELLSRLTAITTRSACKPCAYRINLLLQVGIVTSAYIDLADIQVDSKEDKPQPLPQARAVV